MSLYDILGVNAKDDRKTIKKAYLALSKVHHPDKGGDEEEFKKLNEAFTVLSDPKTRKMYDEGGTLEEIQTEANGLITRVFALFEEAMGNRGFSPNHVDLFKTMRQLANEKELSMERDIERVENEIINIDAIKMRLKQAEVFQTYLENIKTDKKLKISMIEEEKGYIRRILSYISNCEYEIDNDDDFDMPLRKHIDKFGHAGGPL